jgi:endonuclease/exonuclease/phosphatase family metal-dependent hydrolase
VSSEPLVVRTWNLFHGNAVPPERRAFLREMVELVTADRPSLVCLQEVPAWAVGDLARWSGMTVSAAVAARPRLRSARLGRRITDLDHGLFRSAFTGQANAILADREIEAEHVVVLSTSGERRVCQAVRVGDVSVCNFHVTGGERAEAQLRRVVELAAAQGERVILAGDANIRPGRGGFYELLEEHGFSAPLAGSIDQIVVRGLAASAPVAWPDDRRRLGRRLLSDHPPVELTVR